MAVSIPDQTSIDAARDAVKRAVEKHTSDKAALLAFDGRPINAPELHQRELLRIAEPVEASVNRALALADRITEQVEALRLQPFQDPTAALSAVDLEDANRRARFVAEDCEILPLGDLTERVRWVFANAPKPTQWLYRRYAAQRWQREQAKTPQDSSLGEFGEALRAVGIIGPTAGLSREAQALAEAAGKLRAWARGQLTQAVNGKGTGAPVKL